MKKILFLFGTIATTAMSCVSSGYTTTTYPRRQPYIYRTNPVVYPTVYSHQNTQIQNTNVNQTNINNTNINNNTINNTNTTINNTTINSDHLNTTNNNITKPAPSNINPIGNTPRPNTTVPSNNNPVRGDINQTRNPNAVKPKVNTSQATKPITNSSTRGNLQIDSERTTIKSNTIEKTRINQQSKNNNNTLQKTNTKTKITSPK